MVHGCQAEKVNMVHSLHNYTHSEHSQLMLTGILHNLRDRCSLSSLYSPTVAEIIIKKTSSADMSRSSSTQAGCFLTCSQCSQHHARRSCPFLLFWGLFTEYSCTCPWKYFSAVYDNISSAFVSGYTAGIIVNNYNNTTAKKSQLCDNSLIIMWV